MITPQIADVLCSLHAEGQLPITQFSDLPTRVLQDLLKWGLIDIIDEPKSSDREIKITERGLTELKEAFAAAVLHDFRPQISDDAVGKAVKFVTEELYRRLREKGDGAFVSRHEIVGIIGEEFDELKTEVHNNSGSRDVISELADIAVPAIFGIACIESGVTKDD